MGNDIVSMEKYSASLASQATNWLMTNIEDGTIKPIPGYDAGAELSSAMMHIMQTVNREGKPALSVCTKESVISSLRDMAIQGLSMVRNQCYPIVCKNQLQIWHSYFGKLLAFNRMFPNLKASANVVHEGDKYYYCYNEEYNFHYIKIEEAKLENRDKPIVCAYGFIMDAKTKEKIYGIVMTKKEIDTCWLKSQNKSHSVHNEFPEEMAKKTVFNRLTKIFINTATTPVDPMMMEAFKRTMANEFDDDPTPIQEPTPVQKAIRSRSKGAEGLKDILSGTKANAEDVPVSEPVEPKAQKQAVEQSKNKDGEITPKAEENAPEPILEAFDGTLELDGQDLYDNMDSLPF